jgi:hypothetical protein
MSEEVPKQEQLSPGQQKIQEYISRIQAGESKEEIMKGLSPSFIAGIETGLQPKEVPESQQEGLVENVEIPPQYKGLDADTLEFLWTIPEYVNSEKTEQEKQRKQKVLDSLRAQENPDIIEQKNRVTDEVELEKIRKDIGIGSDTEVQAKEDQLENLLEDEKNHLVSGLVKYVTQGRKQAVVELYQKYLDQIDDPESREKLVSALCQDIYNKYRKADYPIDLDAEKTWDYALSKTNVEVNNKKKEWMYRGVLPKKGQETLTRGSMNVDVTPELIDALDDMIASGKIKANYKFGQPDTSAGATERHDSISIYFLEEPSPEVLEEIGEVIKPYVRGDTLLGKKVADGFFMSEIGSIETDHIDSFIAEAESKDVAFAQAIKKWTSPTPDKKDQSLKMSEAQFYAIKDVARAFGYEVSYSKDAGFELKSD